MRKIAIKDYEYKTPLGCCISDVEMWVKDEDYEKYQNGANPYDLESLAMDGEWLDRLDREIMAKFLRDNYKISMSNIVNLHFSSRELKEMMLFMGFKSSGDFSKILGVSRTAVILYLNGTRRITKPICLLLLERLRIEMKYPGINKRIAQSKCLDEETLGLLTEL